MGKAAKRARVVKAKRASQAEGAVLVRGIRRRLRVTQEALAKRLGVGQMTISRWEHGEAPVRPAMRLALEAVVVALVAERRKARAARAKGGKAK